tara:strand:+ start:1590 stop:2762 length:1173 start_codon:yes stop_codon:yes gene_type:complete
MKNLPLLLGGLALGGYLIYKSRQNKSEPTEAIIEPVLPPIDVTEPVDMPSDINYADLVEEVNELSTKQSELSTAISTKAEASALSNYTPIGDFNIFKTETNNTLGSKADATSLQTYTPLNQFNTFKTETNNTLGTKADATSLQTYTPILDFNTFKTNTNSDLAKFGTDLETYQTELDEKASGSTLQTFQDAYNTFYQQQLDINSNNATTLAGKADQSAVNNVSNDLDAFKLQTQTDLNTKLNSNDLISDVQELFDNEEVDVSFENLEGVNLFKSNFQTELKNNFEIDTIKSDVQSLDEAVFDQTNGESKIAQLGSLVNNNYNTLFYESGEEKYFDEFDVQQYLDTNQYATESYVDSKIPNIAEESGEADSGREFRGRRYISNNNFPFSGW